MNITLDTSVSIITVFLQGLISFFSPCVLPLLPVYMGYLAGGTAVRDENGQVHYNRKKVLLNTIFFVIGVSFAFFLLGFGMSAIGRFFSGNQMIFTRIGAVIVILFGLYQLGIFGSNRLLNSEVRLPFSMEKMSMSPITAVIMGFVLSFAWSPCVGPILSSVLIMAASTGTSGAGFFLIGIYTLGYIIPFLLVGLFTTGLIEFFSKHKSIVKYTVKLGGVLMIIMGILMFSGHLGNISNSLAAISGGSSATVSENSAKNNANNSDMSSIAGSNSSQTDYDTVVDVEDGSIEIQESADESTSAQDASSSTNTESSTASDSSNTETTDESDTSASDNSTLVAAPDFSLVDQYGNIHSLSDYKGKVVFLNFWATWCPPCNSEMPDIQELYDKYSADPNSEVAILSVAFPDYGTETSVDGIKEFLDSNVYTYPVLMDENADLLLSYYITAYPTTFIINADGYILGYIPGAMDKETMESVIAQALE